MPEASNCQTAIDLLSGLQRQQSRSENSSSLTQSEVPLISVCEPSDVSRVIFPFSRFSTYRSFSRTYPTRLPSGENLANIRVDSLASPPSLVNLPPAGSQTQ